ncbi:MAG TPA: GtrA family protein [Vicinamibacterales bacterium]
MVMRLVRFSMAGLAGFAVQVAALAFLVSVTNMHYLVATILAVEAAILINFVWHDRWTWRDRPPLTEAERWRRLARFNAMTGLTSIAGSVMVTAALVEMLSMPPIVANIISVIALGTVNFAGANTLVFRAAVLAAMLPLAATAQASTNSLEAKLQPKTAQGFAKYVAAVEARRTKEIANNEPFLEFERYPAAQQARVMASMKRGEVYVERGRVSRDQAAAEITIDGGLINHWRGTVFVPNVTLDDLLKVLQEPQTDKHKQEDVLSSRVVSRDGDSQKVFLRLRRTKFVTVVYDTEYDVDYKRLAPDRALSNSISTRIVEIENPGTPRERALPEGNDHGYMWRLNSYWRYKQVDGGVLVEIESLTLSRDLPAIIGSLIRPIVNSTARESMTRTLASVRARFAA